MESAINSLASVGVHLGPILVPAPEVDIERWAVIACDQFTSDPDYWDRVEAFVGDSPSTLRLILPEVYLGSGAVGERVRRIGPTMQDYLERGVLREVEPGITLVRRTLPSGGVRRGLMVAVDLEAYSFESSERPLIRPSEQTILDRLPPRMDIRRAAAVELPHVLVLMDDPDNAVIGTIERTAGRTVYSGPLMFGAGKVEGVHYTDKTVIVDLAASLKRLASAETAHSRYGTDNGLLFAVGDGNHSLATAKQIYENAKAVDNNGARNGPLRYALVELINIYDDGLTFEPIHRLFIDVDAERIRRELVRRCGAVETPLPAGAVAAAPHSPLVSIFLDATSTIRLSFPSDRYTLAVEAVEDFIDGGGLGDNETVDYVHGTAEVSAGGRRFGNCGIILPVPDKSGFFRTVAHGKVLPRKSFSLGEAEEKRFYVEGRKLAR